MLPRVMKIMNKNLIKMCEGASEAKCCRKWDPFQGLKLGSCLTLRNESSKETHADKARDFIGKGCPGGEL